MGRSKNRWRFALQIVDGPNVGLGAGSWRIWSSRNDIYVASLNMINTVKASLHESGRWRVGYTSEHMDGPKPLWSRDRDRAVFRFAAPPFIEGRQDAFVIATWRNALILGAPDGDDVVIPIDDNWDILTGVKLVVVEPGVEPVNREAIVFEEPIALDNGRAVWLQTFEDPTSGGEPEPVPAGQMVRVLTPEVDGVPCPGFLVVGLRVG